MQLNENLPTAVTKASEKFKKKKCLSILQLHSLHVKVHTNRITCINVIWENVRVKVNSPGA